MALGDEWWRQELLTRVIIPVSVHCGITQVQLVPTPARGWQVWCWQANMSVPRIFWHCILGQFMPVWDACVFMTAWKSTLTTCETTASWLDIHGIHCMTCCWIHQYEQTHGLPPLESYDERLDRYVEGNTRYRLTPEGECTQRIVLHVAHHTRSTGCTQACWADATFIVVVL